MLQLDDLIIRSHETLRTALERMTRNRKGVLFVCDADHHVIGALSDGDVRRTLLDDTLLVANVSKAMNTDPVTAKTVEEGATLLRRFGLVAVAVVRSDGKMTEALVDNGGEVMVLKRSEYEDRESDAVGQREAVVVIPARGGSKRIPRKNLALVAGKSLLAWAILAAKGARNVGRVIVSTDDPEIAEEARTLGVEVPWLRPAALGQDDTSTLDVILHALEWSVRTLRPVPRWGVLLEPTAPLREPEHIDEALELLSGTDADSVVSVCEVPHIFNPEELLVIENGEVRPYLPSRTMNSRRLRGHQSPTYVLSGLVTAFRISSVLGQRSLYGERVLPLITNWEYFLDVDVPEDLRLAEIKKSQLLKKLEAPRP